MVMMAKASGRAEGGRRKEEDDDGGGSSLGFGEGKQEA